MKLQRSLVSVFGFGVFVLLAAALFVLPTPGDRGDATAASADASGDFAIVDVRVFDGERLLPEADVWVADGRIRAIGPELDLPAELERVAGQGMTLLPGLFDAHVHTWGTARADAVRFGVTTLLDQFTGPHDLAAGRADRDRGGATDKADLFSAGILATAEGGHGTQFPVAVDTVDSVDEVAEWVAARQAEGSDWIKIVVEPGWGSHKLATLDRATVGALITAAHDAGLKAVVHVSSLDDALAVTRLGADGLVHVWRDRLPSAEEVQVFRDAGIFVIPTLVVMEGMADPSPSLAMADGDLGRALTAAQRAGLGNRFPSRLDWQIPVESVRLLAEAGVPILAGSDAPNPATAMGFSIHRELELLVMAGLGPEAALAAATSVPAKHFGIPERGRITAGALADLVLVKGDPASDIAATHNLVKVWKAGRPISLDAVEESSPAPIASAQAPDDTLLADFEDGLTSRFGHGWTPTTDQRMGGKSTVELAVTDGSLVVRGEIQSGSMFPWAGAMVFPGPSPMAPIDLSSRGELRFRVRGDGRRYSVMVFTGDMQGIPPSQTFTAEDAWATVTLPLTGFAGADFSTLRGISFTATAPPGAFQFAIDDVELR